MDVRVQPAILEQDLNEVKNKLEIAKQWQADGLIDGIQLDVMDGAFVPNTTYNDPAKLAELDWGDAPVDLHMMIEHPLLHLKKWAFPNVRGIMFHQEAAQNTGAVIDLIHKLEKKAIVTINPHTPTYDIKPHLEKLDAVMIMGVEPGFSAQAFNADVLDKITYLRELQPEMDIYVDGGVNGSTAKSLRDAGATVLCSNSFLFGAASHEDAINQLITG